MTPAVAEPPNMLGPHTSQFLVNIILSQNFLPKHRLFGPHQYSDVSFLWSLLVSPYFQTPKPEKILSLSISLSGPASIKHVSYCIIITCFKSVSELKLNFSRECCCFITLYVSKGSINVRQMKNPDVSMKKWIKWLGADSLPSEHKTQNSVTSRRAWWASPFLLINNHTIAKQGNKKIRIVLEFQKFVGFPASMSLWSKENWEFDKCLIPFSRNHFSVFLPYTSFLLFLKDLDCFPLQLIPAEVLSNIGLRFCSVFILMIISKDWQFFQNPRSILLCIEF